MYTLPKYKDLIRSPVFASEMYSQTVIIDELVHRPFAV